MRFFATISLTTSWVAEGLTFSSPCLVSQGIRFCGIMLSSHRSLTYIRLSSLPNDDFINIVLGGKMFTHDFQWWGSTRDREPRDVTLR